MRHFHPKPVAKQRLLRRKFSLLLFWNNYVRPLALAYFRACPSLCHRSHTDVTQAVFPKHYPCFCLACTCVYVTMYQAGYTLLTTKYTYLRHIFFLVNRIRMDDARCKFYLLRTYLYTPPRSPRISRLKSQILKPTFLS